MAKTRAEIQKAYRQRQKIKDNEGYLRKERERRKKNYIPSSQLSKKQVEKRNKKNREYLRTHREKIRHAALLAIPDRQDDIESSDSGIASTSPLIVNLPFRFPNRRNGPRRRTSRALAKANRKLNKLNKVCNTLRRKVKTAQRRVQRIKKSTSTNSPRSRTNAIMREANLSPDQQKKVRRQLLLGNVVLDEVKDCKRDISHTQRNVLHHVVAGKIIRKYRCLSSLSKATGLSRNSLGKVKSKSVVRLQFQKFREVRKFKSRVIDFLEREDNCRTLPGKADSTKVATGVKVTTRVLTDYLSNLHIKFLSENSDVKLSLASFSRIRPNYIKKTAFITRDTCLCTRHQNMALILKAIQQVGVPVSTNPETFIKDVSDVTEIVDKITSEDINYGQWKRVAVEEKGKTKMVMKIVDETVSKAEFSGRLKSQYEDFSAHVVRVKTQYSQILRLKENLPTNNVIIHMDFAENYNCKSVEEIQSAYWNQTSVTLHPAVIYYKPEGGQLCHKSYVIVSDELGHNSSTVLTFLKHLIPEAKLLQPSLEYIHYLTDSPTSQYRNKIIFHTIANHKSLYGIPARWNYFEAGHGKGPCDGLGGTTKRMADEAVRCGKVVIQDALDFMKWAENSSMKNVKFVFVPSTECQEMSSDISKTVFKVVKGTMKLHAVGVNGSDFVTKYVSCYCDTCLSGLFCDSWTSQSSHSDISVSHKEVPAPDTPLPIATYKLNDFIAANYRQQWYIGKILDIDEDDHDAEVSFMVNKKDMFQYPAKPDIIWVKFTDIICKVSEPIPSGKSMRMFRISLEEREQIESKFNF